MDVLYYGDFEILSFNRLDSTQTEAKRRLGQRPRHRQVIWASEQTAGQGRHRRQWHSPQGNLYATVLWRLKTFPRYPGRYSFTVSMAIRDAVVKFTGETDKLQVKWPNDILFEGAKLSGLLLEMEQDPKGRLWMLIGVGANIAYAPQIKEREAVSLADIIGDPPEVGSFVAAFLDALQARIRQQRYGHFRRVREDWLNCAYGLGQPLVATLRERSVRGTFTNLGKRGELIMTDEDGTEHIIRSGEVFFDLESR